MSELTRGDYNATVNTSGVEAGRIDAPRPYQGEQTMAPAQLKQENRMRSLAIRQLDHGYMVEVGCQTFAIESPSQLIAKLAEYITNPLATEQKWQEGKLF